MTDPNRPHQHDHRQCRELFARLSEYLDREMDEISCRDVERHLKHCDCCQACFNTLKQTVALCREMPPRQATRDFTLRLRAAIEEMAAGPSAQRLKSQNISKNEKNGHC